MAREILLVRHGEAYNSVEPDGLREVSDRSNPPLTPRANKRARLSEVAVKIAVAITRVDNSKGLIPRNAKRTRRSVCG